MRDYLPNDYDANHTKQTISIGVINDLLQFGFSRILPE